MPKGIPFQDSRGVQGGRNRLAVSKKISGKISFGLHSSTHIELRLPDGKFRKISKGHGIKLAHWLLDNCSDIPQQEG